MKQNLHKLREEELKNKIAQNYFGEFDCTQIIGNVDFCVSSQAPLPPKGGVFDAFTPPLGGRGATPPLGAGGLWAEAKKGVSDVYKSVVQLILTIGKARTFDKVLPPPFLGAFDAEKIAFLPYNAIQEVFYQNDFNWNVAPSNHETKEFKQVYDKVKTTIENETLLFFYEKDDQELREFIKTNFVVGNAATSKVRIDKNNFITIYTKWLAAVKPTIVLNWEVAKKNNIIDGDFYLADLLSQENESLKDNLYVLLKKDYYELDKILDEMGMFQSRKTFFNDKQKAHTQFWNKYERPPKEQYWDYIVERRDLLVPQDIRERKGSFFTPQIWVELSQEYLAKVLGEDWQDEYYIWDCASGTGNLLTGLTNKLKIFVSTLDRQDVDVIKDRIQNGANLMEDNVFQFDFLNDSFEKLPKKLQEIINSPEKRKKLVIYINPPYAEHTNKRNLIKTSFKDDFAKNQTRDRYSEVLKKAKYELFAQFMARVYQELSGAWLAEFSKLKLLQSPNFADFRNFFNAKLEKCFVVPANSFDNVKGQFPIGFKIWNTAQKEKFTAISVDVYEKNKLLAGQHTIYAYDSNQYINEWIKQFANTQNSYIGFLNYRGNDFQHQNMVFIENSGNTSMTQLAINRHNLLACCVYFAVRHCIAATWLNDREQFLYPHEGWQTDTNFQHNCLAYTLFINNIQVKYGTNHWLPFTEKEVNARQEFESSLMTDFILGKLKKGNSNNIFEKVEKTKQKPLQFSPEATAVFSAGRALWAYYHESINKIALANLPAKAVDAAFYDIREYFQGRNTTGKMNNKSADEKYNELLANLRESLDILAKKIEPKIYEYEFLKR